MKNLIICTLLSILSLNTFSECINEGYFTGARIQQKRKNHDIWVLLKRARFVKLGNKMKLTPSKKYFIQYQDKKHRSHISFSSRALYNETYIEYYTTKRLRGFLSETKDLLQEKKYQIQTIGKSIKGEPLFYIGPQSIDSEKKNLIMFGRHHGDEGTANWIIEGFVKTFLEDPSLQRRFNLFLYPMVNPDGANARTRHNANGRDLNRAWMSTGEKSYDEVVVIYSHLEKILKTIEKPSIVLDMHGSFTRDFIYRVKKSFKGEEFFNHQQDFISFLGKLDEWQNGNFDLSNGDSGMSRIRLITRFNLNALTHETPRDIKEDNPRKRSVQTLKEQGDFVAQSISKLY